MKRKLQLGLALTVLMFLFYGTSYASPAYPDPISFTQPDGSKIIILLKGDEFVNWAETIDGYTVMFNNKGAYEYAVLDANNNLTPGGVLAKNADKRSTADFAVLGKVSKGLKYSSSQLNMFKSVKELYLKSAEQQTAFPTSGSRKLVCILMAYKDVPFTKTQADFNNLFNQINYTADGATGSVKDFYNETSYGKLNLSVTVVGPYTAANNMSYYGAASGTTKDVNARALVTEAVNLANPDVNYADFDNDNNGAVDGVYVIYAGYGQEAGASSDAIWAHASNIPTLTLDGKTVSKYSCSPELRGNSGTGITRIGVICHEFGHVLGAPDFYDTDYETGGQFQGTGKWDLMASGSWNNGGATPAQHNAYTKVYVYNWATVTTLNSAASVTVANAKENSNSFYRFNTPTANEYYLMENRQKLGFDASLPGKGLLIYHVSADIASGGINKTHPQKMYPVCASATSNPTSDPASYGAVNSAGCPFPGSAGKTSFTDATLPSAISWAGVNSGKPVTEITENTTTKVITFNFMGGAIIDNQSPSTPTGLVSSNITTNSVVLSWNASTDNIGVTSYDVYKGGAFAANVAGTTTTITGLNANTDYSFYVKAKDAAGNNSLASATITVHTATNADDGGALTNGVVANGTMSSSDGSDMWYINVGQNATSMRVVMNCGTVDYDTYGKFNAMPSTTSYDWRGYNSGSEDNTINNPQAGKHYIMVDYYSGSGTGSYTIKATITYASGSIEQQNVVVYDAENASADFDVRIFPVPAKDRFTVNVAGVGTTNLKLVDLSGKVLYEENTGDLNNEINVGHLANGVYILKIKNGKNTILRKVIVNR